MYLRKHISNIKNKISFLVRFSEIGLLLLLSDIIIRSKKQVKHNTPSASQQGLPPASVLWSYKKGPSSNKQASLI
jgi:hypothetical protein